MEPISSDIWKEILNNQKFPLIGSNKPNEGNGFHDSYSWKINFFLPQTKEDELLNNTFFSVYMRDLSLRINPNLSRKEKLKSELLINDCSDNYYNTFLKYFTNDYHFIRNEVFKELGIWGESLCRKGRLIFEIIGWYDNNSKHFFAYELNQLDSEYCKIYRNNIVFNAPISLDGERITYKKVKIPKEKCIIIEFPKELGGYENFTKKVRLIRKLGNKHDKFNSNNPEDSINRMKNWDKNFNKIVSDWGASNKSEEVTEFYNMLSALKFANSSVLCLNEIIEGLQKLIEYLNNKLNEKAKVNFEIEEYNRNFYKLKQDEWINGNLSFEEANELLRY